MVSAGSYILGVAALAAVILSLGFSAVRLRQRLLPGWEGAPARLVETIVAVALLIWLAELLGVVSLLYAGALVAAAVAVAVELILRPEGRPGAKSPPSSPSALSRSCSPTGA